MKLSPSRKGKYLKKKLISKKYVPISTAKIIKAIASKIDTILIFIAQVVEGELIKKSSH
tara:strand:- start:24935 stop:25111 length:177 start_codon:yes stop_codon:yes gene_type:complete